MTETPILWYRDFHDVPRLFCIRTRDGYVLFDCAFDDKLDEYAATYEVTSIEGSELDPDTVIARASATPPIATIAVELVRFDDTKRRAADVRALCLEI